jgi:hypothetical protein
MIKVKAFTIITFLALLGIFLNLTENFSTKAENDEILNEIFSYKSWEQIHKPQEESANNVFKVRSFVGGG